MGKGAKATLRLKRPASVPKTRDLVYVKLSARHETHQHLDARCQGHPREGRAELIYPPASTAS